WPALFGFLGGLAGEPFGLALLLKLALGAALLFLRLPLRGGHGGRSRGGLGLRTGGALLRGGFLGGLLRRGLAGLLRRRPAGRGLLRRLLLRGLLRGRFRASARLRASAFLRRLLL